MTAVVLLLLAPAGCCRRHVQQFETLAEAARFADGLAGRRRTCRVVSIREVGPAATSMPAPATPLSALERN